MVCLARPCAGFFPFLRHAFHVAFTPASLNLIYSFEELPWPALIRGLFFVSLIPCQD